MAEEESRRFEGEQSLEAFFDGDYVTIQGRPENVIPILRQLMQMNPYNERRISQQLFKLFKETPEGIQFSGSGFNGDIYSQDGKMIRLLVDRSRRGCDVSLGGGGNFTTPEEIKQAVTQATGLKL